MRNRQMRDVTMAQSTSLLFQHLARKAEKSPEAYQVESWFRVLQTTVRPK
jgi:hypothetical protein